ncbi:MAG: patatin family protein [Kiritimatiellae bacterium]|nr:patatin family protein [Kiritimatiellia bacterium]
MKCGLILEGGAMRGLFTAGVLDVFMENKIAFDGAIGVSAGACFGCNYKSGQIGRVIRYNKRFSKDPRYCSWKSLVRTGDLFNADFCYRELPMELDVFDAAAYAANPMEFHVVATDCATGKSVYRKLDKADAEAFRWIQASASMPIVSRPVQIGDGEYLDGGLSDGIPLRHFESLGYERNVVVTTRPRGYRKFPSWKIAVAKPFLRRYPEVYAALRTRHVWYNEALEYINGRVKAGAAFLIAPDSPLEISRLCHDPEQMQRVYDAGREAATARLAHVRKFLGQETDSP